MAKGLSSTVRICDAVSLKLWLLAGGWSLVMRLLNLALLSQQSSLYDKYIKNYKIEAALRLFKTFGSNSNNTPRNFFFKKNYK